jgi:hypothetical protein
MKTQQIMQPPSATSKLPAGAMADFAAYLAQAHYGQLASSVLHTPDFALLWLDEPALSGPAELQSLSESRGPPAFLGQAPAPWPGVVAVFDDCALLIDDPPPASFRLLAIVPAYNEEDIIALTIADLIGQGLDVYLIDNWSSDQTIERAKPFLGRGLIGFERFPPGGPTATYDLGKLLQRVEYIGHEQRWASWVMLHDADERRRSPWPGVRLREAIWHVDRAGFSCIDHVTLNFWPVDNEFGSRQGDVEQHFRYFEFSSHPGHFHQRRGWKQTAVPVSLAASAGHDVQFPSRRVYPYKFLLKHYPVRSQAHGEHKVLCDRIARWNPEERTRGWHRQYDDERQCFLRDPGELLLFDEHSFDRTYLIQRLSGAGIFTEVPPWATPPRW